MTDTPEMLATRNGSGSEHTQDVRAERVEISQGSANSVAATTVSIQQGGAGRVQAEQISITQGGVGMARADTLRLEAGSSGGAVIANEANLAQGSNVLLLISRNTTGDIRPLLDWRAAAAIGVALGVTLSLLRRR